MKAFFKKYQLQFKSPVLTSRGQMQVKNGYYLFVSDGQNTGTGECSFIEGLSKDDLQNYEPVLQQVCDIVSSGKNVPQEILHNYPSITFGLETAMADFHSGGAKILFPSAFTEGKAAIPINGLVWMGSKDFMLQQIQQKLADGFKCIKIKVGAIDFNDEIALLSFIRQKFSPDVIEIRLDANGAFNSSDVFSKLEQLAKFNIHSIEQPVKACQYELMGSVCKNSPIAVALDEELIAPTIAAEELLTVIKPQYLILKPSLLGGFSKCDEWISLAQRHSISWWVTSALESNIGLNAIAQWVFTKGANMVQGLGTGGLYTNNIDSPLYIANGSLLFNPAAKWGQL